jgi:hypothetical protein
MMIIIGATTVRRGSGWKRTEGAPESWKKPLGEWPYQRKSQQLQNSERKVVANSMRIRSLVVEEKSDE